MGNGKGRRQGLLTKIIYFLGRNLAVGDWPERRWLSAEIPADFVTNIHDPRTTHNRKSRKTTRLETWMLSD